VSESRRAPVRAPGPPIPREHGAWGLLLQPFAAAALLAGPGIGMLLPALLLIVLGFLMREPLLILARQRWLWREPNPQTPRAARWLLAELGGIALCLAALSSRVPLVTLAALSGLALALTLAAVWFALKNRQRSVFLQLLSAAGLGSSALLVASLDTGWIPVWAWQLWGILTLHAAVSILVVRSRLEGIAGRKASGSPGARGAGKLSRAALYAVFAQGAAAAMIFPVNFALAAPPFFSAVMHGVERRRLGDPATLGEPLQRVGFRALGVSLIHMGLTVAALWPAAKP